MKRFILIVLIAGLLIPAGLHAQKVYKDGAKVALDLSVAAGMPARAVTDVPKTWTDTPTSNRLIPNNDVAGSINATVYQKLEIAPQDLDASGALSATGDVSRWVDAFNYCRNLSYDGGGWRLPTQRELMLICIFKPALESFTGLLGFSGAYWSATEHNSSSARYTSFVDGRSYTVSKNSSYRARCVREITN